MIPIINRIHGAEMITVKIESLAPASQEVQYVPRCGYIFDLSALTQHSYFNFHFTPIPPGDRIIRIPIVMRGARFYGITGSFWNGRGSVVIGTARKEQDRLFELRSWNAGDTFCTRILGHAI